jgi:sugar phosphate isomerase/epimerase
MATHLTRREFGAGLLGAAVTLLPLQNKIKPSVVGGIEIGVQSYTFRRFSLDKMIETMQAIGLSSLELWDGHLHPNRASEADFKAAKKKLDDAGIRVNAYCVNFPPNSTDELLDRAYGGALLLGTRIMTTSVRKPIVPRLDEWCRKYKIRMGLHNHWYGAAGSRIDRTQEFETPDDFLGALKGASEYLSINLDIGHFSAAGFDPVAFIRQHHRRIVSLHIKDRDKDEARTHRVFGKGATPVAETMKLLKKIKFKHAANIEYESEPDNPVEAVKECFQYLKQSLA